MHRVFVYGTLKKGLHNHHLLSSSLFIGNAYTVDSFRMFGSGFPVIVPQTHDYDVDGEDDTVFRPVYGEVYDVSDEVLAALDQLEAEGVMYDRKMISIILERPEMGLGELVDGNVSVYIGKAEYWKGHLNPEYTDVNAFGELEWRNG